MKRFLSITISVMLLIQSLFICSITAQAKTKTYSSGNYQYIILSDKTARITNYKGDTPDALKIPSKLSGHKVTSIGKNAFENKTMTELTLPDTLKSIGASAFFECKNLKSVTIPKSVTKLYGSCFRGCRALESIELHNGIKAIGQRAFSETAITTVTLPDKLTEISYALFKDCKNLESIIIPETVTSIGGCAFCDCTSINEITIPNSVKTVGNYAFCACKSLREIIVPDTVISIGVNTFERCTKLKSVTLGKGISEIPAWAFMDCRSLEELNIKGDIKSVGNWALHYTKLSEDEKNIENGAVYYEDILFQFVDGYTDELNIKEGTRVIADYAFRLSKFKRIHIPASVENIGTGAFFDCRNLSEITVDNNNGSYKSEDGILYNGKKTVLICVPAVYSKTTRLKIPDTVKKIRAFSCTYLRKIKAVELGENVTSIEVYAFFEANSLKKVKLNGKLKKIGVKAFCGCYKVNSITVPKSVKTIEDGALGMHEWDEEGELFALKDFELRGYGGTEAEKYCFRYANLDCDEYGYVTFVNLNIKAPKLKIKKGKNKMRIYRSAVKGADGYQISYTADGKTTTKYIKNKKTASKLIKNLEAGKYSVKIRAYKLSKQGKDYYVYVYGKWSKAKTVKL